MNARAMIDLRLWRIVVGLTGLLVAGFSRAFPPDLAEFDEIKLTFTTTVFAEPCISDEGKEISIGLPPTRLSQMTEIGDHSTAQPFILSFSQCPPGMKRVKMTIGGEAHLKDPQVFANLLNAKDVAQNIGIRVWSGDNPLDIEKRWYPGVTRPFDIDQKTVKVHLKADMFTLNSGATAGHVQARIPVTMSYE